MNETRELYPIDERAAPSGHFGFGVYESCAAYSNLSVYRPFIEPPKCQYAS